MKKYCSFAFRLAVTAIIFIYIIKNVIVFDDVIHLTSGEVITGNILQVDNEKMEIQVHNGEKHTVFLETTKTIEHGFFSLAKKLSISIFFISCIFLLLNLFLTSKRLSLLLRAQNIEMTFQKLLKINWIAQFFSNFLPGFTGGDIVKVYYINQKSNKLKESLMTVLFDRVMGLVALIWVASFFTALNMNDIKVQQISIFIFILLLGSIAGIFFLFYFPISWLSKKLKWFFSIVSYIENYKKNPKVIFQALLLSVIIHCSTAISVYGFSKALGITNLPISLFFIYVPISFLVMMLPISLAGWGVGEATYAYLFNHILSNTKSISISILSKIGNIFIGAMGGILWLTNKNNDSKTKTNQVS